MMTARKTVSIALVLAAGSLTGCGWFGGGNSSKQAKNEAQPLEASPVAFQESFDTQEFNQLDHRTLAEYDHFIVEPSSFSFYGGRGFKRGTANGATADFDRWIRTEVGSQFPIVQRQGPNTVRLQFRVTDFRRSPMWQEANPGFDPMAPEMNEAFCEVRMVHSHTGEVVGRFLVEQSDTHFGMGDFVSMGSDCDVVFEDWACQIRDQLAALSYDALMAEQNMARQANATPGGQQ